MTGNRKEQNQNQKKKEQEQKSRWILVIETYRDLIVYQKSYGAALEIHKESLKFPSYEKLELGGQIRRASKSVAYSA